MTRRAPKPPPFNKATMTASDLMEAASALQSILQAYDSLHDIPEDFLATVAQYRDGWNPNA